VKSGFKKPVNLRKIFFEEVIIPEENINMNGLIEFLMSAFISFSCFCAFTYLYTFLKYLLPVYLPELTDLRMCLVDSQLTGSSTIIRPWITLVHKVGTVFLSALATCG
jgi:hypothetical protein